MDILDAAMQRELNTEKFYKENVGRITDKNAARMVERLAREERKHYDIIKEYKAGKAMDTESLLVADVNDILQATKRRGESFIKKDDDTIDVLNKALEIEDTSVRFYREKLETADSQKLKDALTFLKKEEDKHYTIIGSLIDFFMKPETWNEWAELTHLDQY